MKKKYIALIMIVMAACFGTLALPSPAAKPAADTTVSVEYLQQIEQQNQRMADSVALLRMEQRISEIVDERSKSKMDADIMLFGTIFTALTAIVGIVVPLVINQSQRKKLDETAEVSQQAVADINQLKTTIQEYSEQAKDSVQKAQKSANDAKALTYFMQALKEEDLDRQIDLYTKSIKFGPNYAEAYINRGNAYDDKGDYDNAIADYTKAIEINPQYTAAYYNRGNSYFNNGDLGKAIDSYTMAIKIDPNDAEAYYNRGVAYDDKGEYGKAIEDYDKAIEINPDYAEAYYNRGIANMIIAEKLEAEGKTAEALAHYKDAVKDFDNFLKMCKKEDKDRKKAIEFKQKCEAAIERLDGGKK